MPSSTWTVFSHLLETISCTNVYFLEQAQKFPISNKFVIVLNNVFWRCTNTRPMQFNPWFFFFYFFLLIIFPSPPPPLPFYFHLFAIDSHDHDCAWMKKMGTIADKLLFSPAKKGIDFSVLNHTGLDTLILRDNAVSETWDYQSAVGV